MELKKHFIKNGVKQIEINTLEKIVFCSRQIVPFYGTLTQLFFFVSISQLSWWQPKKLHHKKRGRKWEFSASKLRNFKRMPGKEIKWIFCQINMRLLNLTCEVYCKLHWAPLCKYWPNKDSCLLPSTSQHYPFLTILIWKFVLYQTEFSIICDLTRYSQVQ